ncbi:MAG: quinone-dependent dihydroorotate dehydrogenase [Rhizobiales bacterium]|nr:quinone-dependent dihydroorotate dehydrogenase [Hyphomicrobiales bacterium]
MDHLLRPLFAAVPTEVAHRLAINALRLAPLPPPPADDARLRVDAFGLSFPNPVGIAAGFDKNGEVIDPVLRLGFGFAEAGTVTPQPQSGNPRPRLFRLPADRGVINRLGFNNDGHGALATRLAKRAPNGIVGINIGANKDATDRIADYVAGVQAFARFASYFTVNISSPNTPGLRDLQRAQALDDLLARVIDGRDHSEGRRVPILVKIAPDVTLGDLDDIVGVARQRAIDGMIVSNTTISRPPTLRDQRKAREAGGLSGAPLFPLATRMLAETYVRVEGAFPLVGVGGIDSGAAAVAKIQAGASLIQLYSGLVYRGVGLLAEIKASLLGAITQAQENSLAALVGTRADAITAEPWPQ